MPIPIQRMTQNELLIQVFPPRLGQNPDFMLWLGAGASVSSKIPAASSLVVEMLREVYAQESGVSLAEARSIEGDEMRKWAKVNLTWFNPDDDSKSEYAKVMENVIRAPDIRAQWINRRMEDFEVSNGYNHLGLLLKSKVFDTVLTTNFDALIRKGADYYLKQPITEVSSLESYPRQQPFPQSPRIIRLHGDFWHGNIQNTEGELENTPRVRYEAVRRLLYSYGLIVIGYGGWDRKIMKELLHPLWQDSNILGKGAYWCHRKGDFLSPLVKSFLEDAPAGRAFLVEIEDFDSLMEAFASRCGVGIPTQSIADEYKMLWDDHALLSNCIEQMLPSHPTPKADKKAHQQKLLTELAGLLGDVQAGLFCYDAHSQSWQLTAETDLLPISQSYAVGAALQAQLAHSDVEYLSFAPAERSADELWLSMFASDRSVEIFPIRMQNTLQGFVAFAVSRAAQTRQMPASLNNHPRTRLIKTAARLLTCLSAGTSIP